MFNTECVELGNDSLAAGLRLGWSIHKTGISQMDYSAALTKATKFLEVIINGILIEFDIFCPFTV